MSYILITGSEGLIGTQLISFLEKWRDVQRFDIKFPRGHEDYGDILDIERLRAKADGCIGIIHLAAISRVVCGEKDPDKCWQTNFVGTQNVLQVAKESPLKPWVLYASSREVYGQQQNLPVEIDAKLMPMNIYARSKAAAEEEVLCARDSIYTAVVRYSSVYGSVHDHEDRVTPAFCRAAALGASMKIEGSNNILDFTHVDDTVKGTLAIISELENGNNKLPPLHLTTGIPTTLEELAALACKSSGRKSDVVEAPGRSYDVSRFWGATTKTNQLLNWQAEIPIETGVYDLIQQFKSLSG